MFPNMNNQTLYKRESIYPHYDELLWSFIKYIIDETDHEVYLIIIKRLNNFSNKLSKKCIKKLL